MEPTTWRRALVAVAAIALVAAAVVAALGSEGRFSPTGGESSGESIDSKPDPAALQAASRGRQTQVSNRAENGASKGPSIVFEDSLVGTSLLAAAVAWLVQPVAPAQPALQRRRHSRSLRGPPAQLALIS